MKFASRLVNFDVSPQDPHRPMSTPIYQTATFEQVHADSFGEYDYSRSGNPTRKVLEDPTAWDLDSDGTYQRRTPVPGGDPRGSQERLLGLVGATA